VLKEELRRDIDKKENTSEIEGHLVRVTPMGLEEILRIENSREVNSQGIFKGRIIIFEKEGKQLKSRS